jgi:hypothetical protein
MNDNAAEQPRQQAVGETPVTPTQQQPAPKTSSETPVAPLQTVEPLSLKEEMNDEIGF